MISHIHLTNNPVWTVEFLLQFPSFERRVPHLLLAGAAHAALLNAQDVAVVVAYDLTHDRREPETVEKRPVRVLLVRRRADLEMSRGQDAQHVGDAVRALYLGCHAAFRVLRRREGDELVGHARDHPGHRVDDGASAVGRRQAGSLQDGDGGEALRVIV